MDTCDESIFKTSRLSPIECHGLQSNIDDLFTVKGALTQLSYY